VASALPHICESLGIGEVLGENSSAILINFHLPDSLETGPFKT
jgi:hypothetical protein